MKPFITATITATIALATGFAIGAISGAGSAHSKSEPVLLPVPPMVEQDGDEQAHEITITTVRGPVLGISVSRMVDEDHGVLCYFTTGTQPVCATPRADLHFTAANPGPTHHPTGL